MLFTLDDAEQSTRAFWGAYGVSKQALRGLVSILGEELAASPVRVN